MEVTIENRVYRTGRLNAFQQFHIARKLAPAIMAMASVAAELPEETRVSAPDSWLAKAFMPIAEAISSMSEKDADYVLQTCLTVCERKEGASGWGKVFMPGGGLMYQQGEGAIGLKEVMQLVVAVVKENLGNFFPDVQPEIPPSKA